MPGPGARARFLHADHHRPRTAAEVELTHDPRGALLYTKSITVTAPAMAERPGSSGRSLRPAGREFTITTDRHVLSEDARALTVTDRGFGNVLTGLARNETATIFTGPAALTVSLVGAAPEVADFAACEVAPSV